MAEQEYFSVKEISQKFNISTKTVYAWIRQGKLKAIKLGEVVRIHKDALNEFVKE